MPKKIKKKPLLRLTRPGEVRMSEVIAEFAEPLLSEAPDEKSSEIAIMTSVVCWNLSFMPEDEIEKNIQGLVSSIESEERYKKDTEDIVRMLLDRKKSLFPYIRKMVAHHEVMFSNGQMYLNVVSMNVGKNI